MPDRICKTPGCGATISMQSKRGWCRPCAAKNLTSNPEVMERRRLGRERYFATPGVREERGARLAHFNRTSPPEHRAWLSEHGKRMAREVLARPDVRAASNTPEVAKLRGQRRTETVLGWCPPELRDQYRQLCASQRLSAAEARRIIEAEIPGTEEHAKREVANHMLASQLRHERHVREAY